MTPPARGGSDAPIARGGLRTQGTFHRGCTWAGSPVRTSRACRARSRARTRTASRRRASCGRCGQRRCDKCSEDWKDAPVVLGLLRRDDAGDDDEAVSGEVVAPVAERRSLREKVGVRERGDLVRCRAHDKMRLVGWRVRREGKREARPTDLFCGATETSLAAHDVSGRGGECGGTPARRH